MAKMGRPSKFNEKIQEIIVALFEKGKTIAEVAELINVAPRTLKYWIKDKEDFLHSVKESKALADNMVEASLYERATGYSHAEEKVFTFQGEIITHTVMKHYPPDPLSMIYWLKNRKPAEWRDRVEPEDDGEEIHNIPKSLQKQDSEV